MTLALTSGEAIHVIMIHRIKIFSNETPNPFGSKSVMAALKYFFKVEDIPKKLKTEFAMVFHQIREKALFWCKRAPQNIQLTVGFFSTRVKFSDKQDWI